MVRSLELAATLPPLQWRAHALQTTAKLAHPGSLAAQQSRLRLLSRGQWGAGGYRGGNREREKHPDNEGASRKDRAQA